MPLRELKRVATISGIIFSTFLVVFFAIHYHYVLEQTSKKPHRTNRDATDGSIKANDMEPNEAEDTKELVKLKESVAVINKAIDLMKKDKEIKSRFSNVLAVLEDNEVQVNGKLSDINEDKVKEAAKAILDYIDSQERDKEIESRFSNVLAVLEDSQPSDKTDWSPDKYQIRRDHFPNMVRYIEILNLENKTQEEIREELYIDFSTLDTSTWPKDKRMDAKMMLIFYANAFQVRKLHSLAGKLHPSDRNKYDIAKFNIAIVAVGVENFMKAATQFCKEEAAAGEIPIVSIGSGDGTVEKEIIAQYGKRFGKNIRIQLVDPEPSFEGIVDFKTVDQLIAENPSIVGNCVAYIIWPNPEDDRNPGQDYDIEAIRKLQPKAVLAIYETTGGSGSENFRTFLYEDSLDDLSPEEFGIHNWLTKYSLRKKGKYVLDNYAVLEVARQKVLLPRLGASIYRMVKIIRKN